MALKYKRLTNFSAFREYKASAGLSSFRIYVLKSGHDPGSVTQDDFTWDEEDADGVQRMNRLRLHLSHQRTKGATVADGRTHEVLDAWDVLEAKWLRSSCDSLLPELFPEVAAVEPDESRRAVRYHSTGNEITTQVQGVW